MALKFIVLFTILLLGLLQCATITRSLFPPYSDRKDFIQEYLMGKAVVAGTNPYLPCRELAARLQVNVAHPIHPHSNPHPPPVVLLSIPLGFLAYQPALIIWFLVEISCIVLAAYLLLGWLTAKHKASRVAFLVLLMLSWRPFRDELILGQLMSLLLVLLMGAWLALGRGRDLLGGICLGSAVAIKLIAWPLVVFLALRKKWRASLTAMTVAVFANLAAVWFIGIEGVAHYYLEIGPAVSSLHKAHGANTSLWTVGWRLFEGTGASVFPWMQAPPLFYAPKAAYWVSLMVPLGVSIIVLWLAVRARSFDISFGMLICLSLLVSPTTWSFYFTLLVIPLFIIGRCLYDLDFPTRETNFFLAVSIGLYFPSLLGLLEPVGRRPPPAPAMSVPWGIAMLTLMPAVILLGLIYVLWQLDLRGWSGIEDVKAITEMS